MSAALSVLKMLFMCCSNNFVQQEKLGFCNINAQQIFKLIAAIRMNARFHVKNIVTFDLMHKNKKISQMVISLYASVHMNAYIL